MVSLLAFLFHPLFLFAILAINFLTASPILSHWFLCHDFEPIPKMMHPSSLQNFSSFTFSLWVWAFGNFALFRRTAGKTFLSERRARPMQRVMMPDSFKNRNYLPRSSGRRILISKPGKEHRSPFSECQPCSMARSRNWLCCVRSSSLDGTG